MTDVVTHRSEPPTIVGKSKHVYMLSAHECMVRLIPTLRSFTFDRDEIVEGTEIIRLDFYELAAHQLAKAGIATAFETRVSADTYRAIYCKSPPFETIVKNIAIGSTLRKYPGLFADGHVFVPPVVKLDYRMDPEDEPIAEDYVVAAGYPVEAMKLLALQANDVLRSWLAPNTLLDICFIIGWDSTGEMRIASEISPDCMRLRAPDGTSLDKDLFRVGRSGEEIMLVWSGLVADLKQREPTHA